MVNLYVTLHQDGGWAAAVRAAAETEGALSGLTLLREEFSGKRHHCKIKHNISEVLFQRKRPPLTAGALRNEGFLQKTFWDATDLLLLKRETAFKESLIKIIRER